MGYRFIKSVILVFVFCFTYSSYGSIELVLDDSNFDFFNQGSTLNISIVSQNESENFSMFLDVFKHDTGYVGELTDRRTGQIVSNFSLYSTGPIDSPDFI